MGTASEIPARDVVERQSAVVRPAAVPPAPAPAPAPVELDLRDDAPPALLESPAVDAAWVRAAARERHLLARDLHDSLGQELWALSLLVDDLAEHTTDEGQARRLLAATRAARSLHDGLRDRLAVLRSSQLGGRSLAAALQELAASQPEPEVRVHVEHAEARAGARVEDQLWCVVLEALANARRHGTGGPVEVCWSVDDRRAVLEVANPCCAGAVRRRSRVAGRGLGLRSIAERLDELGGTVRAGPTGTTWSVQAVVPHAHRERAQQGALALWPADPA